MDKLLTVLNFGDMEGDETLDPLSLGSAEDIVEAPSSRAGAYVWSALFSIRCSTLARLTAASSSNHE